ncbi:endolytic transglycosylase MltG [uncultured Dialister sp.]|uniref:endolytic transglycosylase MltG n=1 Tax=uncultured Dialister sp. TaxID=278064 RepID=UPI0025EC5F81|nr:endolytic transglycosylase MltG [uncultured Dialister sp.]
MQEEKKENSGEPEKESLSWKNLGRRKLSVLLGGIAFLILLTAGLYFYAFDRVGLHGTALVDVPKNATGRDIADTLEKKGVIRSSTLFRLYSRILGSGKSLQSGTYKMKQGLTIKEAMMELRSGKTESVLVTVPEGYTVHQIASLLQEAGVKGAGDFEGEAASYGPLKYQYGPLPVAVKAEGFLFPDTYNVPKEYTARQICDMMYKRTDAMLTPDIRQRAKAKHLTLHALVTLASMVEREARFKEDQVPIASVMLKRLEIGMPLQIDATIQYALGSPKEELTIADTKIDSPYNTYTHKGLPPGPIGSPGLDAIEAVLDAKPGEYLYYVAQADGHHVFTKSYEEHQAETENIYGK